MNTDSSLPETTKKCPYCAETILVEAVKCRYCKEFLYEDNVARCENCGTIISPDNDFCSNCNQLHLYNNTEYCENCGVKVLPGENFCSNCNQLHFPEEDLKLYLELPQAASCSSDIPKKNLGSYKLIIGIVAIAILVLFLLKDSGVKKSQLDDNFSFTCINGSHRVPYAIDRLPEDSYFDLKNIAEERCREDSEAWNKAYGTKGYYTFSVLPK